VTDLELWDITEIVHSARPLDVRDLGLIGYEECWDLQRKLAALVLSGEAPDTLLLLEHPHTYTCGRAGGRGNILASEADLARLGASVIDVDRGGDVTYHGPGQLVAYPIVNLFTSRIGRDYRAYVRSLEKVLIGLLADFDITAYQIAGLTGAWVRTNDCEEKIAAIGVKVDGRGVTTHGIALNVNTDLSFFEKIIPCGISDKGVTSMSRLLGGKIEMGRVKSEFARHFKEVFSFC